MNQEFKPGTSEILQRALGDLRIGIPVVVSDGNHGIMALAVEAADDDRLARAACTPGSRRRDHGQTRGDIEGAGV